MAGTAVDYATALKDILVACKPGNVTVSNVAVAETLDQAHTAPNAMAVVEGWVTPVEDTLAKITFKVSADVWCSGSTRDAAQDVAKEARDAITIWVATRPAITNPPARVKAGQQTRPQQRGDGNWETRLTAEMTYEGVAKVVA